MAYVTLTTCFIAIKAFFACRIKKREILFEVFSHAFKKSGELRTSATNCVPNDCYIQLETHFKSIYLLFTSDVAIIGDANPDCVDVTGVDKVDLQGIYRRV